MRTAPGGPQGRADISRHNQTVPADREADACACPACAGVNRGPAALVGVSLRGPIQCESGRLDPLDAQAMTEIEGGRR